MSLIAVMSALAVTMLFVLVSGSGPDPSSYHDSSQCRELPKLSRRTDTSLKLLQYKELICKMFHGVRHDADYAALAPKLIELLNGHDSLKKIPYSPVQVIDIFERVVKYIDGDQGNRLLDLMFGNLDMQLLQGLRLAREPDGTESNQKRYELLCRPSRRQIIMRYRPKFFDNLTPDRANAAWIYNELGDNKQRHALLEHDGFLLELLRCGVQFQFRPFFQSLHITTSAVNLDSIQRLVPYLKPFSSPDQSHAFFQYVYHLMNEDERDCRFAVCGPAFLRILDTHPEHFASYAWSNRDMLRRISVQWNDYIKQIINVRFGPKLCTMMHMACKNGDMELLKFLLSIEGVDVKAKDDDGNVPIQYLESVWEFLSEIDVNDAYRLIAADQAWFLTKLQESLGLDKNAEIVDYVPTKFLEQLVTVIHGNRRETMPQWLEDSEKFYGFESEFQYPGKGPVYLRDWRFRLQKCTACVFSPFRHL